MRHRFTIHRCLGLVLLSLTITKLNPIIAGRIMPSNITINKDYILVEPKEGINYREIRRAIARLFYVSEIPEKNGIWVFREGQEKFSYDDLYKLKDIIKENIYNQKYRDFNEDIIVEPPLTETGELKDGWYEMSIDNWIRGD